MTTARGTFEERLDELVSEGRQAAERRERTAFDAAAGPFENRIVLYGAGSLGRRLLQGLRANGIEPLAFADRNAALSPAGVGGLPVLSPEDAARSFGADAVFVIAVWHPVLSGGVGEIARQLAAAGCRRIVPFSYIFWKYPETFLPYYLWNLPSRVYDAEAAIRETLSCLAGPRSKDTFLRQLELRLTGNFDCLGAPDPDPQYFPSALFGPLSEECFIDCGAYNGDTLADFAGWTGGRFRQAVAFEADPENFLALKTAVESDERLRGRVRPVQQAVGAERATVMFAASGLASASILQAGQQGSIEVTCVPLDEALGGEKPTYIKMDIEGAEIDALMGARAIVREHTPLLAICAYHTQSHLWEIPALLRQFMPDARLLLRPYRADGFDLVCYAAPNDRTLNLQTESLP